MTWVIIFLTLNTLILALAVFVIDFSFTRTARLIISASDLNLKAHTKLLEHFEGLERDKEFRETVREAFEDRL